MEALSEEKYRKLQREVSDAKANAERAQGALDQLMEQLKNDYGCETLKEAKAKLVELEEKKNKAQRKFDAAMKEYQEKWKQ